MSDSILEQRLAKVEEQLSAVLARLEDLPKKRDWRDWIPTVAPDDELQQEHDEFLREFREQDRERSLQQMDQKKFFPVKPDKHAWRSTVGMFGDDPILQEIADEALRYREEDRAKARQATAESEQGAS